MTINRALALTGALLGALLGALTPTAGAAPVYDYNTGAQTAWDAGFTGHGQNIAIVDSGIDAENPWIQSQVVAEACPSLQGVSGDLPFCKGPGDTPVWGPVEGPGSAMPAIFYTKFFTNAPHGTGVAGAAAGAEQRTDGEPTSWRGMAPDAGIIGINAQGYSNSFKTVATYLEAPLTWLDEHRVELGLSVVNISSTTAGGTEDRSCDAKISKIKALAGERDAIYRLISHGIPVVAAAGNVTSHNMGFPACLAKVISVGSIDPDTAAMAQDTSLSSQMTILAPGEGVRTPSMFSRTTRPANGTSYATPLVSGAVALYLQRHPKARPWTIKKALQDSGEPTRVRAGLLKPRLQVDRLLGLDEEPTGKVNTKCLKPEFVELPNRAGTFQGAVRFLCRPSLGAPGRVSVIVDGPSHSEVVSFDNVALRSDTYYRQHTVRLSARPFKAKSGTYRTCFLYYGTEDDVWPVAKDCRYDDV